MNKFIKVKLVSCLFMLLMLSSASSLAQKTSRAAKGCPNNATKWDVFKIKEKNVDSFIKCFEALESDYDANRVRNGMSLLEMHNSLLKGYAKLREYYNDDNTGDDEDKAAEYEEKLDEMKKKKAPKPPAKSKDSEDDDEKESEDKDDDGNDHL